jgi:predicted phage tail protein
MMDELIRSLLSGQINESILNQQYWVQLPSEQQQILDEILENIHDIATDMSEIVSNERKVLPQYQTQFRDAMVLKLATELGMINRGEQQ